MRIIEIFSLWGKYKPRVREHAEKLRMKCPNCGHWNRVPASKIFIEQNTFDSEVKAYIRVYEPLEVVRCKKCGKVIARAIVYKR